MIVSYKHTIETETTATVTVVPLFAVSITKFFLFYNFPENNLPGNKFRFLADCFYKISNIYLWFNKFVSITINSIKLNHSNVSSTKLPPKKKRKKNEKKFQTIIKFDKKHLQKI